MQRHTWSAVVLAVAVLTGCSSDGDETAQPSRTSGTSFTDDTSRATDDCASIEVGDPIPKDFSSRPCEPDPYSSREIYQCLDGTEFMLVTINDSHLGGFDGGHWERTDGPPAGCTDLDH